MRRTEQRRKYLVFLLMLIVLFSVSSDRLFLYKNTKKDPIYNSVLHMKITGQTMTARMHYIGGLYGLNRGTYRLDFGHSFYPLIAIPPDQPGDAVLHTMTVHDNGEEQVISIPLKGWSHRFLKMSDTITFQFRGDVSLENHGLLITVENMTTHPVTDCRIYYTGRFFHFGEPHSRQHLQHCASGMVRRSEFRQKDGCAGTSG